ncbi:type I-E CRISPR-associated protein Cas5/CasD [Nocardiopsis sp. FIRDI 009]|uniref:type I-E CRISPR-associated protein Cas5/CasD n=1 Tax=Nocardiopsis sp. FIRDI 009 TaxID=714197 RepID=UPI000E24927E|nr:type I-E CRISPR-associated protein Cas5/CasD [Nocardiopsis sp. FIRDI 009]
MSGLLIRLTGPMQSWGEHSSFGDRDTIDHPTRSALIGMFAAAEGRDRSQLLERYEPLTFTIRIDRPGVRMVDFHTIGGAVPARRSVPTAEGKRRSEGQGTIVTRRSYLSDAVFTVAVEGPSRLTEEVATALESPRWAPYLGRRGYVPDEPLLLRAQVEDPVRKLREEVPLAPRTGGRIEWGEDRRPLSVRIPFVEETASADQEGDRSVAVLNDVPVSFAGQARVYRFRSVSTGLERLPGALLTRGPDEYRRRILKYVGEGRCQSN